MYCKGINGRCGQTSGGRFLRLAALAVVGIAFCMLAGCSETRPQWANTADHCGLVNEVKQQINYKPFIWRSDPPDDCPFEESTDIVGVRFTGKCNDVHIEGAPVGDTWYFSWASDDKLIWSGMELNILTKNTDSQIYRG